MAAPMIRKAEGVYKRGSRYVYVVYVNGKQRKGSAPTLSEAKRRRAERKAQINREGDTVASRARFGEYAEQWIERYAGRAGRLSPETRAEYRRDLARYACPFFDDHLGRRLTKITPLDVNEFITWLGDARLQGRRRAIETRTALEAELESLRAEDDAVRPRRERVEARLRALRLAIQSPGAAAEKAERLENELSELAGVRGARARRRRAAAKAELPMLRQAIAAASLRELSPASVRRILAPVRACFATARIENLIHHNPADGAILPARRPVVEEALGDGEEDTERKALSREQLRELLAIVHPEHRLMFRFLAATGLRWSELTALRWGDLQLDGSRPHVRVRRANVKGRIKEPKSKYGRRDVPLVAELVFEFRRRRSAERGGDQELVFSSSTGGLLDYSSTRRRVLLPAAEEVGVPWMGFHTFRHTCASLLFARGASAVQVQRWLGHHSPAFTLDTYVHLLPGDDAPPLDLGEELGVATRVATRATTDDRNEPVDALAISGVDPAWDSAPPKPAEVAGLDS